MTRLPDSSPTPVSGDACEAFAMHASLRADRELGRAEQAALDAHLAVCPNCRERAQEALLVSRVLKHWDAERASSVQPPARLGQSVRSLVAEEGARRRRDFWRGRVERWSMAASILLVVGAGLLFGLRRSGGDAAGDVTLADVGAPAPVVEAVDVPAAPALSLALDRAAGSRVPALAALGAPDVPSPRWMDADGLASVARAVRYLGLEPVERDFLAGTGEAGIPWARPDGRSGRISAGALASLRARGVISVEAFLSGLAARTGTVLEAGHVYGGESTAVYSRQRVPDVLPIRSDREGLEAWLGRADLVLGGGRLRLHAVEATPDPRAPAGARHVFDLDRAFRDGQERVRLVEGGGDDVVLIVRDTRHPIFIPAGELLQGGRVDRVIRHNTWIPAVAGEERFELACVPVSTEGGSQSGAPRPTGLVAGPRMRRLLADEASAEQVSAYVDELTQSRSLDFSLLSRFPLAEVRVLKQQLTAALLKRGWRGFGMTDAHGRLAGIEITGLPPEAGADLLARVALGYELEDALRRSSTTAEAQATGGGIVPARVTLMELLAFEGRLRVPAGEDGALRRAVTRDARSNVVVEVLEHAPSGDVVLASALAGTEER